ncbi:MAG: TatD family hydrolase [Desulfobacteraceae bacterium]|nr:TatD family hydrolase [Desulfobacteraceae bacterium]
MAAATARKPLPRLSAGLLAVDSHCHLDMADYPDRREVIRRAQHAGVGWIVSVGIDLESSLAALRLAETHPGLVCALGVHPHYVGQAEEGHYRQLAELARHPRVVAYGEIGLDYVKNHAPRPTQRDHFRRQVELAKGLDLPLIIHDREAHADVMAILKAAAPFPRGGVMHCYSGDMELAAEVVELGLHLSIPGIVTFAKAEVLQEVARTMPLTSMLIETDGPYLAPVPFRGQRNEPAYVLYTAAKIAELRRIPLDEVARQTTANAVALFRLDCQAETP